MVIIDSFNQARGKHFEKKFIEGILCLKEILIDGIHLDKLPCGRNACMMVKDIEKAKGNIISEFGGDGKLQFIEVNGIAISRHHLLHMLVWEIMLKRIF